MKRVGLIGAGKIGGPIIAALERGELPGYELVAVLTRSQQVGANRFIDPVDLWSASPDIVIETAGADAVREHARQALEHADLWVASGVGLVDPDFRSELVATAQRSGRELRVLTGALAGLDAISTAAVDPDMNLSLQICVSAGEGERETVFQGSVADAAELYPEEINVSVAAALAGHGPEHTAVTVIQLGPGEARELRYTVTSRYGDFETVSVPRVDPTQGIHVVAANVIASLNGDIQTLRVR